MSFEFPTKKYHSKFPLLKSRGSLGRCFRRWYENVTGSCDYDDYVEPHNSNAMQLHTLKIAPSEHQQRVRVLTGQEQATLSGKQHNTHTAPTPYTPTGTKPNRMPVKETI